MKFVIVGLVIVLVIVLFIFKGCGLDKKSTLTDKKILSTDRKGFRIEVFDYHPNTDEIFYIERNSYSNTSKKPFKRQNYLMKYNLNTKERSVVFSDFYTAYNQMPWFQVLDDYSILLYDNGYYDNKSSEQIRNARIIILKDNKIIDSIPVVSGLDLRLKSPPPKGIEMGEEVGYSTAQILKEATNFRPIAYNEVYKLRFRSNPEIAPKYLLINYKNEDFALDINRCHDSIFLKYKDKFAPNLAPFNSNVSGKRSKKEIVYQDDFKIVNKSKGIGYYNFPCEKYYHILYWKDKKKVYESCARGYFEFPVSMNIISNDGHILYRKSKGIFKVIPID